MKLLIGFGIGLVLVVAAWVAVWAWLPHFYPDMSNAGQLGDSFGLITSLFSGLTMIGAAYAVYAQNKQLQLAHKQDAAQREQLQIAREQRAEDAKERDRNLKLQESQAIAQRLASELRAYDSLVQHYSTQIDMTTYNKFAIYMDHHPSHKLNQYLQMVTIVLTEIQYPDHEFDWKLVYELDRNRFTKYFLVLMRESKSRYQTFKRTGLKNHIARAFLMELRGSLKVLIKQDGFDEEKLSWITMCIDKIEKISPLFPPNENPPEEQSIEKLDSVLLYWMNV